MVKHPARLLLLAVVVFAGGCGQRDKTTVTQFGHQYLTVQGSFEPIRNACDCAMAKITEKEVVEGITAVSSLKTSSSTSKEDRKHFSTHHLQTKGKDGAKYEIKIVQIEGHAPLILLESTSDDPYRLMNAIKAELQKHQILVN